MTASRFERGVGGRFACAVCVVLAAGCGAPLPSAEPPGRDPADPDAPIPERRVTRDPLHGSAFEGVKAPEGSGHEHHHHHGPDKAGEQGARR